MEYKAERVGKKIKLYSIFEVEAENGDKVRVRKLVGENTYKKMMEQLDLEKIDIQKGIDNAKENVVIAEKRATDMDMILATVEAVK